MVRGEDVDLEGVFADLVDGHVESSRVEEHHGGTRYVRMHRVLAPSLIGQLRGVRPGGTGEEVPQGGYGSKVPLNLDAVDTATRIDLEVARWVRDLGEDDPADTVECLRLLWKLLASVHRCGGWSPRRGEGGLWCCTWHAVEVDARSWWRQARVVSGWDGRPWSPDATCPACEVRGRLRVRFADSAAVCLGCRALWGPAEIGVLADHIRRETGGRR